MNEDSYACISIVMGIDGFEVEIDGDSDLIMYLLAKSVLNGDVDEQIIESLPERLQIAFQDWGGEEPFIYPDNTLIDGDEEEYDGE